MAAIIMVQGTASNVGKSVLVAALCRIFAQDGYCVAPFKAQNMALNSFVTASGLEMGRAQVMQAEAAMVEPDIRMNPILLKPTSDNGSQVIVNGVAIGNMNAADYFAKKKSLLPIVLEEFFSLAEENDIVVIEGAGSPAEINLRADDIVNMGFACAVEAPVILVGDIDRGGVFASLYGTVALLAPEEKKLIKGLVINKFRGDVSLLTPGIAQIEQLTEKHVLGVVPYLTLDMDDEDSLAERLYKNTDAKSIDIAVIRFPHLSNFTDFNTLSRFADVTVRYVTRTSELRNPDLILLGGSKNTASDLLWMRQGGLEQEILHLAQNGTPVFGICGGFQMMGEQILDPAGSEGTHQMKGMGLLPIETTFGEDKILTRVEGEVTSEFFGLKGYHTKGYEIHMGRTERKGGDALLCLSTGNEDGCVWGSCAGTYLHGVFDDTQFCKAFLTALGQKSGKCLNELMVEDTYIYKEKQYDALAAAVRSSFDMNQIYHIMGLNNESSTK